MKRIKYIILFIFILLCCGCSYKYASTTRSIRHSGFSIADSEFKCSPIFPDKSNNYDDKVKYYIGSYFFTEDGIIYNTVLGTIYSNGLNCIKSVFSKKVVAVFDLSIIKADDNNYYYLTGSEDVTAYSQVTTADENYGLYNIFFSDKTVLKVRTINSKTGSFYVLKDDGNVYQYIISKNNNNVFHLDSSSIVYNSNDFGETKIVDFNFAGNSTSTFIKTENSYYRMVVTNADKCYKFADVDCEFDIQLDYGLTNNYDRILAFNGSTVLTTYNKVFNSTDS